MAQSWASASCIPASTSLPLAHILPFRQTLIKCPFVEGLLSLYLTSVRTITGLSKRLLALPAHLESISVSVWRLTPFTVCLSTFSASLCLTSLSSKDYNTVNLLFLPLPDLVSLCGAVVYMQDLKCVPIIVLHHILF